MDIFDQLNRAGEALKATGLDHVTITLHGDSFSVGLKSDAAGLACDCFGHSDTPAVAYVQAKAKQEPKAHEIAVRAEIERRVRAELDGEQRKAA
jgi:hypothetical protein